MAAYRQFVPVRHTESVIRIEDGTMCRMPSPRPGPLRGEDERELPGAGRAWARGSTDGHSWESNVPMVAGPAMTADEENAVTAPARRVA